MSHVKPKKRLGQNFLQDDNIAKKIVDCLQPFQSEDVYEIGPGEGALTRHLMNTDWNLHLLELDPEAVQYLHTHLGVTAIETDFLKYDFNLSSGDFSVIGNLPYNMTSPILFHLIEKRERFRHGVFMVQKEVAERIASPPGNKVYGILSVLLGKYYHLKYEFTVSPGVFFPVPKVKSAVISLTRRIPLPETVPFPPFKKLVKSAFGQRRKTLRNSLKEYQFKKSDTLSKMLERRAEELTWQEFDWLVEQLEITHVA